MIFKKWIYLTGPVFFLVLLSYLQLEDGIDLFIQMFIQRPHRLYVYASIVVQAAARMCTELNVGWRASYWLTTSRRNFLLIPLIICLATYVYIHTFFRRLRTQERKGTRSGASIYMFYPMHALDPGA